MLWRLRRWRTEAAGGMINFGAICKVDKTSRRETLGGTNFQSEEGWMEKRSLGFTRSCDVAPRSPPHLFSSASLYLPLVGSISQGSVIEHGTSWNNGRNVRNKGFLHGQKKIGAEI